MLTASFFLATYLLACLLAIVRHPIFGLMAYLAVFYVHPPTRWWSYAIPDLRWSLLAAGVTFVGLLIHRRNTRTFPITHSSVMIGIVLFILWLVIQSLWALDRQMHFVLLDHFVKFAIAAYLIYRCLDSEIHLKYFLWAHVLGCFAFGLSAFLNYSGGRFEAYGGPGFADANFAGIQAVTGIFAASVLMIAGRTRERIAVALIAPFIVNALVTTVSRSSFLALVAGGLVFLWFCPVKYRFGVSLLGAVALVGFISLSTAQYWERIESITFAGQEASGVDTGSGRLAQWRAQVEMFEQYPLGCGHRCTATLSPQFLDDRYLTGPEGNRARSSHNTFLTLLVEQGVLGGGFYVLYLAWLFKAGFELRRRLQNSTDFLACALPGIAAVLISVTVAEIFVDYLKLEVRIWYMVLALVIYNLSIRSLGDCSNVSERDA